MKNIICISVFLFLLISVNSIAQTSIYEEDFNSSDAGWVSNVYSPESEVWKYGTTSFTGNTTGHWYVSPFNDYDNNMRLFIQSPVMDFTGKTGMTFSLSIRYNTERRYDGAQVEYSTNGGTTWTDLGTNNTGTNWYNDGDVDAIANGADGWSGDNGAWQTASIALPSALENQSNVRFRVLFASDVTVVDDGVAFDNVQVSDGTIIYSEDFNTGNGTWTPGSIIGEGKFIRDNNSFTGNTTNHWYSSPFNNYNNETDIVLTSPVIDLSGSADMTLEFNLRFLTEAAWDGMNLEYSTNGGTSWSILGSNSEGTNWYNDGDVDAIGNNVDGWSGDNGGWEIASIDLPSALNNQANARFRFRFASDGSVVDDGVALDDFKIEKQTPLSSAGLKLWLKADKDVYENTAGTDVAEDGDVVTYWSDSQSDNDAESAGSGGTAPTYQVDEINCNPTVRFFDDGQSFLETQRNDVTDDMTVLAVFKTTQSESSTAFWNTPALVGAEASGLQNDYSLGIADGQPLFKAIAGDGFGARSTTSFADGQPHIAIGTRTKALLGNQNIFVDGLLRATSISDNISLSDPTEIGIGNQEDPVGSAQFDGHIAEVMVFNKSLSDSERVQVESYLAIKYGIGLDQSIAQNYVSSNNTVIYPATTTHSGYINNIAGIGRDDNFELSQNKSKSEMSSSLIMINHSASFSADQSFLTWGNNGQNISNWSNADVPLGYNKLQRTWRVAKTGTIGSVSVTINSADLPALPSTTYGYVLMVDNDGDFRSGATSYVLSGTTQLTATGVSFNNGDHFTIAAVGNVAKSNGNFNDASNWVLGSVPASSQLSYISKNITTTISSNVTSGGIILDTTASLTLTNPTLTLTDSCIVPLSNNTINLGTSTVIYNKEGNQAVTGLNYYNLRVDKTGTKELKGITRVGNEMELMSASSILKTNNLLTLESDVSKTANLLPVPTGAQIIDNATVERYIGASVRQWWHMSSPVSNATAADWQQDFPITGDFIGEDSLSGVNDPSIYRYDEMNSNFATNEGWVTYPEANINETIVAGTGYRVFLRRESSVALLDTTVDLTGNLNVGDINLPVNYNFEASGWNFVGNPYASAIDWQSSAWEKSNLANAIYVWDALNQRYTSFVDGIGVNGGNGRVASGQAFWVQAIGENPVLTAKEQVKVTTPTAFLRPSNSTQNVLKVSIIDGLFKSDMAIRFSDEATATFDEGLDAAYWGGTYPVNICSYTPDYTYYSVNSLPNEITEQEVPFWVVHPDEQRSYMLQFDNLASFESSHGLQLVDLYLGEVIDIYEGMQYEFAYDGTWPTNGGQRFVIRKQAQILLSSGDKAMTDADLHVYPNPATKQSTIQVLIPSGLSKGVVTVVSTSGLEAFSQDFDAFSNKSIMLNELASGVYIITVSTEAYQVSKRLIVE